MIGDDLSESFCLIPSESEPATPVLRKENVSLRQEIEEMQRRLAEAERALQLRKEQDQMLRDSIVMARHQVGSTFLPCRIVFIHEFCGAGTKGYGSLSCLTTTRWTTAGG